MKKHERKTMDDSWVEPFKVQVEKLRDRKILLEEKSFSRIENFLVRSVMCFTDVFLDKITSNWGKQRSKLLKRMHRMCLDAFRWALKSSVQDEVLNLPRFLIRLQEHLRLRQKRIGLSNYKLLHSLALESGANGLVDVECCFVVDFETSDRRRQMVPFFDFSISGFESIKGRIFDPDGREIIDILNPKLVACNWFCLSNISHPLITSDDSTVVPVSEGEP